MAEEFRSGLVVTVPALEPAVGRHRALLDRSAIGGVPAHVTVLYPFLPPDQIDDATMDRLAELFATLPAFEATFTGIRWFGEDVVWVAPEPVDRFLALTRAAYETFPQCPPYRGKHGDPVPHLTLGERGLGSVARLSAAGAEVSAALPITAPVREVSLLAGSDRPASWRTLARFGLAGR